MNELLAILISLNIHSAHLTFDDGPDPVYTKQILSILKEEHVQANFFLVGNRVADNSNIVKQIISEGHDIGGHSMTHKMLTRISLKDAKYEILESMRIVNQYQETNLFRFPYGDFNPELVKIVKDNGYKNIFWDVDTLDWKYKNKDEIYQKFKIKIVRAKDGSIVLMHDIHPQTVAVLPLVIKYLKDNGIQITKLNKE
jgi:peptidoglycan-N-acetylglucosamine deacetylase